MQQVIVVFVYRSRQAILDGYHRALDLSALQVAKYIFEARQRYHLHIRPEQLLHRRLTESSQFSLKSDALFSFAPSLHDSDALTFRSTPQPHLCSEFGTIGRFLLAAGGVSRI